MSRIIYLGLSKQCRPGSTAPGSRGLGLADASVPPRFPAALGSGTEGTSEPQLLGGCSRGSGWRQELGSLACKWEAWGATAGVCRWGLLSSLKIPTRPERIWGVGKPRSGRKSPHRSTQRARARLVVGRERDKARSPLWRSPGPVSPPSAGAGCESGPPPCSLGKTRTGHSFPTRVPWGGSYPQKKGIKACRVGWEIIGTAPGEKAAVWSTFGAMFAAPVRSLRLQQRGWSLQCKLQGSAQTGRKRKPGSEAALLSAVPQPACL